MKILWNLELKPLKGTYIVLFYISYVSELLCTFISVFRCSNGNFYIKAVDNKYVDIYITSINPMVECLAIDHSDILNCNQPTRCHYSNHGRLLYLIHQYTLLQVDKTAMAVENRVKLFVISSFSYFLCSVTVTIPSPFLPNEVSNFFFNLP